MSNSVLKHVGVVLGSIKAITMYIYFVKVLLDSQVSSDSVSILVDLSDLSEFIIGTVLETGNSSLEYFIANEGQDIAKDLVVITIFKVEVV